MSTTPTLTDRERQVLHDIATGATYAEIGRRRLLSGATAKHAAASVYAKLRARNAAHAVHLAHTYGLLDQRGNR